MDDPPPANAVRVCDVNKTLVRETTTRVQPNLLNSDLNSSTSHLKPTTLVVSFRRLPITTSSASLAFVRFRYYPRIMSLKYTLALCFVLAAAFVSADDVLPARLLAEKQVLNKYLVETRDILINFNIYNVGER